MMFSASAQATVYHLMCRGGPGITLEAFDADLLTDTVDVITTGFRYYRGAVADIRPDGSHLAPTECSWATGLLSSKYTQILHFTTRSKIRMGTSVTGAGNANSGQRNWLGANPPTLDVNHKYLPDIYSPSGTSGIFDPARVFHIYVALRNANTLELDHLLDR